MTPSYFTLMATSGILAAVAFLADSVPLLVGAMIISPVFAPMALIAFALVGRQYRQSASGLAALLSGPGLATACAMFTTWLLDAAGVIPSEPHMFDKELLKERVTVGWYSAVAAFAAGVAGAIAMSKDKRDTLVGVVAALALVPAAVASGVALTYGSSAMAMEGLALLCINVTVAIVTNILTVVILRPDRTS